MRHIVVLGAGFGGFHATKTIEKLIPGRRRLQLTLVNKHSHFLFTPLLNNVANGDIERHNITLPIKEHLESTTAFIQTTVTSIDLENSQIIGHDQVIDFDYLILAPGAVTNWQDNENIERWSTTIKEMSDADQIRQDITQAYDLASQSFDDLTRQRALTFAFAGGGATGVELAAELHSAITQRIFPNVSHDLQKMTRFVLIEAEDRLLPNMSPELGHMAQAHFALHGFDLRLGRRVLERTQNQIILDDYNKIETSNLFWCCGVKAPSWLSNATALPFDDQGRIKTNTYLQVEGYEHIFAMGDAAQPPSNAPQTAQTAIEQAPTIAKNLVAILSGRTPMAWTKSEEKEMISLGQGHAAAKIGTTTFEGKAAYALYRMNYMSMLPSTIKKIRLARDWFGSDMERRQNSKKLTRYIDS